MYHLIKILENRRRHSPLQRVPRSMMSSFSAQRLVYLGPHDVGQIGFVTGCDVLSRSSFIVLRLSPVHTSLTGRFRFSTYHNSAYIFCRFRMGKVHCALLRCCFVLGGVSFLFGFLDHHQKQLLRLWQLLDAAGYRGFELS